MELQTHPEVAQKFLSYPPLVREKLEQLRQLILDAAEESDAIPRLEEALRWGEPSYLAPKGSTLRIDWKEAKPQQYAMYFKCTSKLVPSFRAVFGDELNYEGNRAIIFQMDQVIPQVTLKQCILAALHYHKLKHLPELGLNQSREKL